MTWWRRFKGWARQLKTEIKVLGLALLEARTPWYAKLLAGFVVAYALSPLDLIPDAIPLIGLIDELIILPLLIAIVVRLIPAAVLAECRQRQDQPLNLPSWLRWTGIAIIAALWIAAAVGIAAWAGWL